MCCRNFYACYCWSNHVPKRTSWWKLEENKYISQKNLPLRKANFVKKILNSFTQNSPLNVKTYFPQSASLFSLVKLLLQVMVFILAQSMKHYLLMRSPGISASQRPAICSELLFLPFLMDSTSWNTHRDSHTQFCILIKWVV